jgi:hypothetical protein
VRLGVVEEVAGGSLPSALGRFAALHRGVKLEVQIGVSAELIEMLAGSTWCSPSVRSGRRMGIWGGENRWSGPRLSRCRLEFLPIVKKKRHGGTVTPPVIESYYGVRDRPSDKC